MDKEKRKDRIFWIVILITLGMMTIGLLSCNTTKKAQDFTLLHTSEPTFHLFNDRKEIDIDTISLLTLQSLKDFLDWREKNSNPFFGWIQPDLVEYYKFLTEVYDKEPIYLKDLLKNDYTLPGYSIDPGFYQTLPYIRQHKTDTIEFDTIELCPHTIMTTTSIYCDPPRDDCNYCSCNSCGKTWRCP